MISNLTKSEKIAYNLLLRKYSEQQIKRGKKGQPDFILPDKYVEVKTTNQKTVILTKSQFKTFEKYLNLEIWIFFRGKLEVMSYKDAIKKFSFKVMKEVPLMIKDSTHKRLTDICKKSQSYDKLIVMLLDNFIRKK